MAEMTIKRSVPDTRPDPEKDRLTAKRGDIIHIAKDLPIGRTIGTEQFYIIQITDRSIEDLKYLEQFNMRSLPSKIRRLPIHLWNKTNGGQDIKKLAEEVVTQQVDGNVQLLETKDEEIQVVLKRSLLEEMAVTPTSINKLLISDPEGNGSFVSLPQAIVTERGATEFRGTARFVYIQFDTPQVYNKRRYRVDVDSLPAATLAALDNKEVLGMTFSQIQPYIQDKTA